MFLSSDQILERLLTKDNSLVIEPLPDATDISDVGIDFHLGESFAYFESRSIGEEIKLDPLDLFNLDYYHRSILEPGQKYVLPPLSTVSAVSMELISCPRNLAAFIVPKSSLGRLGISIDFGIVGPGFHGKLVLSIHNFGTLPVFLSPGLRVCSLLFFDTLSSSSVGLQALLMKTNRTNPRTETELAPHKFAGNIPERTSSATKNDSTSPSIAELIRTALAADTATKGKALEKAMVAVFGTIHGLSVLRSNVRLGAEEIDIMLKNNIGKKFLSISGPIIPVECKNWSEKVGAAEIGNFFEKLDTLGPDIKLGILVAPNGVTGNAYRDARLKIREKRQKGVYIIVLDRADLEDIADGTHALSVLDRKFDAVFLDF